MNHEGFPGGSDGKGSACKAGDPGLIPGFGRFPGEGNGNPLQYSCLGNPMDRGAWQAPVHGFRTSRTQVSNEQYKPHWKAQEKVVGAQIKCFRG